MILARLLEPKDFGLLGMVTAFTGVLTLFRDFGLSAAAIQRADVTEEQTSTLFWINVLTGAGLTLVTGACAPAVSRFYHEPRLWAVTWVVALGFLVNGAGVQHSVRLQRDMRFTTLASIDVVALVLSMVIAIGAAKAGYGVWALVTTTVTLPLFTTCGLWLTTAWIPGKFHRGVGIPAMMRFGGALTLNGLVMYLASNGEKVLLGRFWGAEALGIYGRAYQLIRIPTDNLNAAVGDVAFSALSRIQDDLGRLRNYFLKGYSLVLTLTLPITVSCALFADDTVYVLLGPKWKEAASIFRLLAPTIMIFAMINPFSWLLFATGRVVRSLKIALVIAPLVIAGYVLGLPYGPKGVALGYSSAMALWLLPDLAWGVQGTAISFWDVMKSLGRPLISGCVACILPLLFQLSYGQALSPVPRLAIGITLFVAVYLIMLLYAMGQEAFYMDLVRGLKSRPAEQESMALAE